MATDTRLYIKHSDSSNSNINASYLDSSLFLAQIADNPTAQSAGLVLDSSLNKGISTDILPNLVKGWSDADLDGTDYKVSFKKILDKDRNYIPLAYIGTMPGKTCLVDIKFGEDDPVTKCWIINNEGSLYYSETSPTDLNTCIFSAKFSDTGKSYSPYKTIIFTLYISGAGGKGGNATWRTIFIGSSGYHGGGGGGGGGQQIATVMLQNNEYIEIYANNLKNGRIQNSTDDTYQATSVLVYFKDNRTPTISAYGGHSGISQIGVDKDIAAEGGTTKINGSFPIKTVRYCNGGNGGKLQQNGSDNTVEKHSDNSKENLSDSVCVIMASTGGSGATGGNHGNGGGGGGAGYNTGGKGSVEGDGADMSNKIGSGGGGAGAPRTGQKIGGNGGKAQFKLYM